LLRTGAHMPTGPELPRSARRGQAGSPFFRSKLRAPVPPDHYVRRPRLVELIDELARLPVTVVVAPAGAGKTSLLADWVAQTTARTAWLSLQESDQNSGQLWTGVIAAIDGWVPGCGTEALALLRRPHRLIDAMYALLTELEQHSCEPVTLVIDDVHRVDASDDAWALDVFVDALPRWLHLVLLSRREPQLPAERLQASGRLAKVRFAQLRFSEAEAVEMLSRLSPSMSDSTIKAAAARANGWAAALQLGALAARSVRAQPVVTPDRIEQDRLVYDYLWHEVFETEDPAVVDVLFNTAVVERVSPSLAESLTGRSDVEQLLSRAESRGLFVTRLDAASWFEVHTLVREMLVNELATRSPMRLAQQHARAARWFEEAGEYPAALDHWLAAGEPRQALRLLARTSGLMYDTGREATILRVLGKIPLSVSAADSEATLEFAWCQLLVSRDRFVETVNQASAEAARQPLEPMLRSRLAVLQSIASLVTGDWAQCQGQAATALAQLGELGWADPMGRFGWNMVARGIALSESWDDTGAEVEKVRHALTRDPKRRIAFEGTRALGVALAGQPVDAMRIAAGVRRTADVANMTILRAELAIADTIARREMGDREWAEAELRRLASEPVQLVSYSPILACLALVEMALADGDVDAALHLFGTTESLVQGEFSGPGGQSWLARAGTRVAVACHDLDRAGIWAARVDDPYWGPVSVARVRIASGDGAEAERLLASALPRCVRHLVIRDLLHAGVERSHEIAVKRVAVAIETAAAYGLLQTVADEGPEVLELVERAAWYAPQEWLDRLRRLGVQNPARTSVEPALVADLTDRERDVLRLLPSRLTLREIAGELYVSLNTLKFHLRVIYRKLGVNSRAEAVEVARTLRDLARHAYDKKTFPR
jgi:LuxR family maltose regulon positive regulatory protein